MNGRQGNGLWIEFGGEGPVTVTRKENALYVASPQPPTEAFLGCNSLHLNGWTRNGDKLTLGIEMSRMTERGCDAATMEMESQAHAILRKPMTMEHTPSGGLRLINENGTLELAPHRDL